ncbi:MULTISPECIES: alpha/beta hydrolase family protein [unclassified Arsukibacterium]|uniref:alpha/beta hydrolase family protein n=1 Tax=unclassified Arsukibacterium TaxID=2635278 RepID=UPI000C4201FF|nr:MULTISPECIES: S9 family peptidase [unclassified Arsukibacterium]MAA95875.1 peptidase S9 [Rheinheimera sp.]MBM32712.1 peptidase S9 [Rheinheimera sp.]HAW91370.1 S9 family peptidase [Candidatus Azambacteria bacterium]|tara:strand:+ start:43579 stop:45519 length:1941 start_codon:yes stop_codon:yes gene_type:complete
MRVILFSWLFLAFFGAQAAELTLEDYARPSQFLDIEISPTGKYLAATSRSEEGNVYLNVIDIKSNKIISVRNFTGRDSIGSINWANSERLLITLVRDIGALEQPVGTGEIFAVDADGSNARMLTGYRSENEKDAAQVINYLPEEDKFVLIVTSTPSRRGSFSLVKRLNIENGRTRQIARAPMRSSGMITDNDGVARMSIGVDQENDNEMIMMYRKDEKSDWQTLRRYGQRDGSFTPIAFLPDNKRVVGLSDTKTDTKAISIMDPETGNEQVLAHHPKVDVAPMFSIEAGFLKEVIGASYEYDKHEEVFFADVKDKTFSNYIQSLQAAFPDKKVTISSATRDNSILVLTARSANHPPEFYLFDTKNNQLSFLLNGRPWLKPELLAETKAIIYKSRDGLDIHAIITLPKGQEAKNLPLIMLPHGGPHGPRDLLEINPDAKVLAQHGYAVLQPNFRGSGGFGREFLQMGYLNWGTSMIDDMTDGVLHLVEQGIVDKSRVCIYGASYGGYAALMSAVREPDLYKCAVSFVGMSDLNLMYEYGDTTESQGGLNTLEMYIGRDKARLDAQSAIKNLDKLKAPIFIIHGTEDQRVPLIQAEVLRDELEKRNHPYEWLVKEKEGHGFYKPENNVERWQKMLAFFDKYIGETEKN